jgi:release factor glutamine methyltransferase
MTVSEARRELIDRFRSSGVESPEVNAEWLLASLLNCSRTELPLRLDETIPDPQLEHLNSQAARRAKREPLQHILGTVCFCGLEFQVTPAVLVPARRRRN